LTVVIAREAVRYEHALPDVRRQFLTSAVLLVNLALALSPAAIGLLAISGWLR
jgi:hypothetical protein